MEVPDVKIAAAADEDELATGASTDDIGRLEVAKAVDTEPEVVPVVQWEAVVCCAVEGMMMLVAAVVTVLEAATVTVLDAATCAVKTGPNRVEAELDPATTDKLGAIVGDADVVEAAADDSEVVDLIALVEVAVVVVGLGVASSGSADVVLGLHEETKNPALQTHTSLSVSLPSRGASDSVSIHSILRCKHMQQYQRCCPEHRMQLALLESCKFCMFYG